MSESIDRTRPPNRDGWVILLYVPLLTCNLTVLGIGLFIAARGNGNLTLVGAGVIATVLTAVLYPVATECRRMQDLLKARALDENVT